MDARVTYQIRVHDGLDVDSFNAGSPVQVRLAAVESKATRIAIRADQAGLIGLLRHLHQQGYALLAVWRE